MNLGPDVFAAVYLVASILFIFGLKGLSSPATARRGNLFAITGMAMAILITLLHPSMQMENLGWVLGGLAVGAVIGIPLGLKVQMTSMPELVAALHSFVGLAAVLVGWGTFLHASELSDIQLSRISLLEISLGIFIGALTFTGSVIAFGKLSGKLSSSPVVFSGQHFVNLMIFLLGIVLALMFTGNSSEMFLLVITILSLILGITMIIPIGGADMPVIVSMLNSYSGWAAVATGFTLENNLMIVTGALVGSSGAILSYIMCKAMNRSFISVVLGGFGTGDEGAGGNDAGEAKAYKTGAIEDAVYMMENASNVILVPGYGMAVAQAQHSVKELVNLLMEKGCDVKFAIHPVAGRMPGHMNVLLAEADIPYDIVFELEDINSEFSECDVALVIGANDVVNPAALTDKSSPIYGMPILEAHKAKLVYCIKRSMRSGYAGVDNELYYSDNCMMLFGDAKKVCEQLVSAIDE